MRTKAKKRQKDNVQSVANEISQRQRGHNAPGLADTASATIPQRKLQELANNSPQVKQLRVLQQMAKNHAEQQVAKNQVVQREGIWDEVQAGFGSKTETPVNEFAENLTRESPEFEELRGKANEEIQIHHHKDLEYKPKPKKGGGTSEAYFKDDATYFNMDGHPAMILSNIIFETANAAQSGAFIRVEGEYKSGEIMEKSPDDYGFDDLGGKLMREYETGDAATRCSIIQERLEWNSFILARPTFLRVKGEMTRTKKGAEIYGVYFAAFDHMLEMNSFEEYYNEYGRIHRNAVEGVLRKVAEQEKNKRNCYLTTACIESKGLQDDCEELTVLRKFRDNYLLNKEDGSLLIAIYYKYAPQIVRAIKRREDEQDILAGIYKVIRRCVDAIKRGDNQFAYLTYCEMVVELKEKFIPETESPVVIY
ncbi:MAG TPA: CFI-box-CTERM domain-containing protein [Chitinophagaceae bacterium]|nr:CFI-box-CTERM domain-containing protein [Chitinophagaceae bacterium]